MMYNKRRQIIIAAMLAIVVIVAIIIVANIIGRQRAITVQTDFTPVKFELNDKTYNINEKTRHINVSPDVYTYRAVAMIDDKHFVITDKIDLTNTKKVAIKLNFSLYNKTSVSRALCAHEESPCPFTPDILNVTYLEGYQWAVVLINSPTLGKATAVLNVDKGKWKLVDFGTEIPVVGYYPESVEEALLNDK